MPRSPVHDVLFCHDILVEIFACLSPGWFPPGPIKRSNPGSRPPLNFNLEVYETRKALQRTLASCAQTCHAFSDIALAELWRVVDRPDILLRILPWRKDDGGLCHCIVDPNPEINGRAWSRFRWYAHLVREMHGFQVPSESPYQDTPDQLTLHRNTWTLLASRLQGEPLLPSLRRLQMVVDLSDIMPSLSLLSPTIRSLTFKISPGLTSILRKALQVNGFAFKDDQAFLDSFLYLISGLSGHPLDPSMYCVLQSAGEEVVQYLRSCTRLGMLEELDLSKFDRHWRMKGLDSSTISPLSRLLSLRSLKLSPRLPQGIPPPVAAPWFAGFKGLRHLSLDYLPIDTLCDVLAASSFRASRSLRSIDLTSTFRLAGDDLTPIPIPVREWGPYLSSIRAALPDNLESLTLWFSTNARSPTCTEPPPSLSDILSPFFSLARLKTLDIFVHYRLDDQPDVADEDLRALSEAFTHLEVLRLWTLGWVSGAAPPPKAPTVAGLAALAKRCPHLRRVSIPHLDVSTLSKNGGTLPLDFGPEGHKKMRFLDVRELVGDNGVAVQDPDVATLASVLDQLFPCHDDTLPHDPLPGLELGELGAPSWSPPWLRVRDAMREIRLRHR